MIRPVPASARSRSSFPAIARSTVLALGAAALLGGCAGPGGGPAPSATPALRSERLVAVNDRCELLRFDAREPGRIVSRRLLTGVRDGERVVGIDYRVSRGVLYGMTDGGRLYTIDVETAVATPVAPQAKPVRLAGRAFGFDFNPAADRIRLVSETAQNLRLHPDTGALVTAEGDPKLRFAPNDPHAKRTPNVVGAAYTYNKADEKLTTNYAIDRETGWLVTQGSHELAPEQVSPNTGLLFSVGPLGIPYKLVEASLDIADTTNNAYAAIGTSDDSRASLYRIDLATGRAALIGRIGSAERLVGMAIEP